MLFYISIVLGALSAGVILAIGSKQLARVRQPDFDSSALAEINLGDVLQRKIDSLYARFALFFKRLLHLSYLYSLLALRRLVIIMRFILTRIERKFARLIDSVHGRGVLGSHQAGPASPFLSQIKDHKETAMAGWKSGE